MQFFSIHQQGFNCYSLDFFFYKNWLNVFWLNVAFYIPF